MRSKIAEIAFPAEAVSVEVVDRQSPGVFLDEDESGAGDDAGVRHAEAGGDGAGQVRLAGAERADQGDDRPAEEKAAEPPAEGFGGSQVGQIDGPHGGHGSVRFQRPSRRERGAAGRQAPGSRPKTASGRFS